ncbi:hypothetical protein Fmac_013990 [Flemingia macrophylla]|uniref:inositol-3-phosphate synthase n=1 Tax=Flemingia macrophylla TaxID=520843 RepID=A0ABD1MAV7_9FABA
MFIDNFKVESPNVKYNETEIQSVYNYETTELVHENRNGTYQWIVKPKSVKYEFKTSTHIPKLGGISWATKDKIQQANYFGSLTQASAIRVGSFQGEEIYAPFKSLLPMVNPDDIVFGGWDISNMNLADAMARAKVFDIDLQKQLRPYMESMVPLPGIYDPDFIAVNQEDRANNVIKGTKKEQVQQIIKDIKEFKEATKVDKVVVLWTANTERYSNLVVGLNDTMENLLASLDRNEAEISPSTFYAIACVMENVPFNNGSPQNTFVSGWMLAFFVTPHFVHALSFSCIDATLLTWLVFSSGLIDLAIKRNSLIGGDDFKSGQTKMKSVLVDFLVGAGIKPTSIVSYNHLGNNDGMNLSAPQTFHSKEISKSNVVDDMVNSNAILYEPGEHPDHVVVIKPSGITKLWWLLQGKFHTFHPVATILSYLTKAPLVPPGTPVVNALSKQRAMLENILRACVGLAPENNMILEYK